jgi:hypothetical protein
MGAIFSVLTLSHALAAQATATDITNTPPEAIVAGVQGAFHVATVIMLVAAALIAGLWQMERQRQVLK